MATGENSLLTLLNLPAETPLTLRTLHVLDWGRTLHFDGDAGGQAFAMTFEECREIRWRIYAHLDAGGETPLVDFAPGRDQHRSAANLLTGHFGLSVYYGLLRVEMKDG
jgi:hypothetical protein